MTDTPTPQDSSAQEDFHLIGIGASAGGLEALKTFFDHVPADIRHSFVIVQHLSPDYKSLMAELLANNTRLPIHEVEDNMYVERGAIYLIPPRKNMTVRNRKLSLRDKPGGTDLNLPIDIFFSSLGEDMGERSIAIVLTGTGSDGSRGIGSIKQGGGMVMVQDPQQAKFDGMPQAAIDTGIVDYILPVEQMPTELMEYITRPQDDLNVDGSVNAHSEVFQRILREIAAVTEFDFSSYKTPTLARRISRRMTINKCADLDDYLGFMRGSTTEIQILQREFLIGVTQFFRDSHAWLELKTRVLPPLIRRRAKEGGPLKIWSVACSTGEEVYSIAMVVREEMARQNVKLDVKIFATDILKEAIDVAGRGIYPATIERDVSAERLSQNFQRHGDEYQIKDEVRRMVIFSQHNMITDTPFSRMDLVLCRNVLIYMNTRVQQRVMEMLHYALLQDGYLLLGSSETVGELSNVLREVNRKARLYVNVQAGRWFRNGSMRMPELNLKDGVIARSGSRMSVEYQMAESMVDLLADEVGLAGVYVNDGLDIVHVLGNFSEYGRLPSRGLSMNLLKMLPKNLGLAVNAAVRRCVRENSRVLYRGLKYQNGDKESEVNLLVRPAEFGEANKRTFFLVVFLPKEDGEGSSTVMEDADISDGINDQRTLDLEEELKDTRESLQATIEEAETANEELQATNEELLAANEELQSTNEELQSVNEELHTVNSEHQAKLEEIGKLNAEIDNLLTSTEIGTLFLDRDFRIRKFTPAIRDQFNIHQSDLGRPLAHFTGRFSEADNQAMLRIASEVLLSGEVQECEMHSTEGNWNLVRVTPFKTSNGLIDGVVISLVDITELKNAEEKIRENDQRFRSMVERIEDYSILLLDQEGKVENWNPGSQRINGYTAEQIIGSGWEIFFTEADREEGIPQQLLREAVRDGNVSFEGTHVTREGREYWVNLSLSVVRDQTGRITGFTKISRDMTSVRQAEEILRESQSRYKAQNQAFEQVLEGTMAGYWDWMIKENTEYLSPTFKKMFGYEDDEMENTPEAWQKLVYAEDLPRIQDVYGRHVSSRGEEPYDCEIRVHHRNGAVVWVWSRGKVIEWDEAGNPVRMVGSHVDITALKRVQDQLEVSNNELRRFAYAASHDLREPLRTISSYSKLLIDEYEEQFEADGKQYLEFLAAASHRMNAMIRGLLQFSRLNSDLEFEDVDCAQLVEDILEDLRANVEAVDAQVEVSELPQIRALPTCLRVLFQNLISNGLKFTAPGQAPQIRIAANRSEQGWEFSVQDNGIGIELKYQERIFEIFRRLHTREEYEGTGIGLAQCKKAVELHDGWISVTSEAGEGSRFVFFIPDQQAAES